MTTLYLASQSPRRHDLLKQIGLEFQTIQFELDETPHLNEQPIDYVLRLAQAKAQRGYDHLTASQQETACVLAADTIVTLNHHLFGKPSNQQQAIDMLMSLSNKTHQVLTAIALYYRGKLFSDIVCTHVTMREISNSEAIAYWKTGEPKDKAGSYAIQGLASIFIKQIQGDYYAVVGLPLFATTQLLKHANIAPLSSIT